MRLAGAVEVVGPGRIRLAAIKDYSATSLHAFIATNIAPATTAKTDGWSAYPGAPGVNHDPRVIGAMAAHVVLPWIHRVFSNLKTWALGVYHGRRLKHLQSYLDAFTLSLQPPSNPPRRLPLAAPHRITPPTRHLQDVDRGGGNGISLCKNSIMSGGSAVVRLTFHGNR